MTKLHLTLALPPNRANARYGRRGAYMAEHRAKKAYITTAKSVIAAQLQAQQQPIGIMRLGLFDHALVTALFVVPGRYDDDNITALCKWPLDSLKQAGVLKDDRRPWCKLTGIPEQQVVRIRRRKGESDGQMLRRKMEVNYRVELTIEEAPVE